MAVDSHDPRPLTDWQQWHRGYDDPTSALSRRLGVVQRFVGEAISAFAPGPRRILSLCAGDARDLLPVLAGARRADTSVTLVERDEGLADAARVSAAAAGLAVDVRTADAGDSGAWLDCAPVDLLQLCGIFGNIGDEDISATIGACAGLVVRGGRVIWTRGRSSPDRRAEIRSRFEQAGFAEVAYDGEPAAHGVGMARLVTTPDVRPPSPTRLFAFTR